jgi:rhodanese-related sulfurtransferase
MAPLDFAQSAVWVEPVVHVGIGFAFGFILERAGFGSAKKLTSQFYLNDMSVLKVMFTAIVTCMVLITATTAIGAVDFEKLWVNPTYLASGIAGGLIFGVGFTLGGYCPGTALVAMATLKLDALAFVAGVLGGIFGFGYTLPLVEHFFNDVTNYGRFTLPDWLGLPMPWVAAMSLAMALGFFAAAEWVETWMRRRSEQARVLERLIWPRAMAGGLGALALLTLIFWSPLQGTRTKSRQAAVERNIANGTVAIEAAELADLMRDRGSAYAIFDIREEGDYNRFHLIDAERVASNGLGKIVSVPAKTIKIIVAPDEGVAKNAYRTLAMSGVENLYWLQGGVNSWMALVEPQHETGVILTAALGAEQPASRPSMHGPLVKGTYAKKIKRVGGGAAKSGGCGG